MKIPFNKPYYTGKEAHNMTRAVYTGKLSGNGLFTKKCHEFFEDHFGFQKVLLTTSCTDALEMSAILCDIKPGDEVIMPSFTFVSTANAFILRGAKIIFADVDEHYPNIDLKSIEKLITNKTKAIVIVHYGGAACEMDQMMALAKKHNILIIEDAAHAIDSFYKGKPLGSIGHFGTFSFHDTKNIISGEGGMLAINDQKFVERAEIIWEKGTNRVAFSRGEVDKYGWMDIGSSFLPSEITASFLYAQLEGMEVIQNKRKHACNQYRKKLEPLAGDGHFIIPSLPVNATVNGNMFFFITKNRDERNNLIDFLKKNEILAVFHYQPLHSSKYFEDKHDGRSLPNTIRFSEQMVRLPLFADISGEEIDYIVKKIEEFYLI